ncbi:4'-phosphopantetheinyl transferase superfamily protein, partial [bacterium]|nr:4'-phosphopantetheinyl transferase superfamily protein [bacterium]
MAWCDWFEMNLSLFEPNNFIDILNEDEKKRADKFKIEKVAKSFILCRGFLRTVLARYLFLKPSEVKFEYGKFGKPSVKGDIEFNLSHSQNTCIIAVSDIKVGIDCEFMANKDFDKISQRFFSKEEYNIISNTQNMELKKNIFYKSWCMRESMAKMTGEGLSNLLSQELVFDIYKMT